MTLVAHLHAAGFFSNFNKVISYLHHDLGRNGVAAVRVDWQARENQPYFVYGRAGDGNVWDHLFEPLAFPGFPTRIRDADAFAHTEMTGVHAFDYYRRRGWQQELHRTFIRHVRIRPEILARVDAILPEDASTYRVGIHYRHPAHRTELPHPMPDASMFIRRARRLVALRRRWQVVVATDVASVVAESRAAFGDRLVVQPSVARSCDDEQLHHRGDVRGLALGEQVLIDALMLARCDALVHVTSNLATAVGYMNPRLRMVYCAPAADLWRARRRQARDRPAPSLA